MKYTIIPASWKTHKSELSKVRRQVFIIEQQVPESLEWDCYDEISYHILATDELNTPIGTGRLKPDGQIGRMAVLKEWRNKGIGTAILKKIIEFARSSEIQILYLHAQTTAIPFYEKHGFKVCSNEFTEAGIPHKSMKRVLTADNGIAT